MRYPYKCPVCGAEVEVSKSMSRATEPENCPSCGHKMKRLYTTMPAVRLVGDGWTTKKTPSIPQSRKEAAKIWDSTRG